MYAKVFKRFVIAGAVIGCLFSFALGVAVGKITNDGGLSFVTVLFGIGFTAVISSFFGMLAELGENVAAIRWHQERAAMPNNVAQYNPAYTSGDSSSQNATPYDSAHTLSRLSSISNGQNAPIVPEYWICPHCKTKNDRLATYCKGCGKYK